MSYTHFQMTHGGIGLRTIYPRDEGGLVFLEQPDGGAKCYRENIEISPDRPHPGQLIAEKFEDVLERMTDAGLCLQLGSTAPLADELAAREEGHKRLADDLRRTIMGQEDELQACRKDRETVRHCLDLIAKAGEPELERMAAHGELNIAMVGLLMSLSARKHELEREKEHALQIGKRIAGVEAKLNMLNIAGAASTRILRDLLGGLEATDALIGQTMAEDDLDSVRQWLDLSRRTIEDYLASIV